MNPIKENTELILKELPSGVQLVIAGKGHLIPELLETIEGGAKIIGENYVQDTEAAYAAIGSRVQWHFIGHLQKNKVKRAVELFDMIETVDSAGLALDINKRCSAINKIMPVLIEVNSAREVNKSGISPEKVIALAAEISQLPSIRLVGLMTMGASSSNPEAVRQYFALTRKLFEDLKHSSLPNIEMKYLSMGMTDSYHIALQEGANIVRIGTGIFGNQK